VRRSILENDRFYQTPLTPALSPLVPRGEREKSTSPNFCRKCATLRHCITDFGRALFIHPPGEPLVCCNGLVTRIFHTLIESATGWSAGR